MTNIKYFIEDQAVIHKKLVVVNDSDEDKLLQILDKGELLKIVMILKKSEKEFLFRCLNLEDIQVEEIE
ncbi:hypothetical protein [Candidatus Enterococcus mansonii]|uniref:Uncharacterized protein n=1 Tax=Candidatus Enterococcus mansonii TaxID=1834181 RepID=A0A242CEK8_9ENTE|nr:hypothetical protein [Enterococcus sp. 4G2_DIV0659]OTO08673.1 hypothetical protein A5880_001673 [Enterococcus sp. 4G2_DIV0659]